MVFFSMNLHAKRNEEIFGWEDKDSYKQQSKSTKNMKNYHQFNAKQICKRGKGEEKWKC